VCAGWEKVGGGVMVPGPKAGLGLHTPENAERLCITESTIVGERGLGGKKKGRGEGGGGTRGTRQLDCPQAKSILHDTVQECDDRFHLFTH